MAQALRSKSVTTTETTIDPTIPSQFEKKKNMATSALDNGGRGFVFLAIKLDARCCVWLAALRMRDEAVNAARKRPAPAGG